MPGKTRPASDGSVVPGEFTRDGGGVDRQIDFTATSRRGQLAFGKTYSWTATIDVPAGDDVTFQVQFSVPDFAMQQPSGNAPGNVVPPACSGSGAPTLELQDSNGDFKAQSLSSSPAALSTIPTNPTASGFIERGLANCQVHVGTLDAGTHRLRLTWTAPASFAPDRWSLREPGSKAPSLRFAWSRAAADRDAAVAAAKRAAKVVVFADCACVSENTLQTPAAVNSLDAGPTQLIEDLSKANPNTVVVTNVDVPTLMPWLDHIRSVLQMWYPRSIMLHSNKIIDYPFRI